jgi:hypothetical protein
VSRSYIDDRAKGIRSEKIARKRGVRQECPLSLLLLDLCLEPQYQVVEKKCGSYGAFVGRAEEKVGFAVQAYTDNVIYISKDPKEISDMLKVLEDFGTGHERK